MTCKTMGCLVPWIRFF